MVVSIQIIPNRLQMRLHHEGPLAIIDIHNVVIYLRPECSKIFINVKTNTERWKRHV